MSHHGGPPAVARDGIEQTGPLDTATWTVLEHAQLFGDEAHDACATFGIESPAGDQGYPGRLRIEARIAVDGGDVPSVRVAYRAKLVDACAATPLNLTQHWGFNLDASSAASKGAGVGAHVLRMQAPLRRLVLDARGVPTGELRAVEAEHDWTRGKRIADAMPDGGYDDFYVWGRPGSDPVVRLAAPSGIALDFTTNQAGVQLYTANSVSDPAPVRKAVHGGSYDGVHCAAFLEFSAPHATFLHPSLHGIAGDTILRAGEVYEHWVNVAIQRKANGA